MKGAQSVISELQNSSEQRLNDDKYERGGAPKFLIHRWARVRLWTAIFAHSQRTAQTVIEQISMLGRNDRPVSKSAACTPFRVDS